MWRKAERNRQSDRLEVSYANSHSSNISDAYPFRRHVFTDLNPYICTFTDCKLGLASFGTRKSWADHEFSNHRVSRVWSCSECGTEFPDKERYQEHAKWKHAPVFTRGQLELLTKNAEKHTGAAVCGSCPFCAENPGTKVRAFSMHVAKHMEEIALGVLPRDGDFENDLESPSSDGGTSEINPSEVEPKLALDLETSKKMISLTLADFNFLATIGKGNFGKILLAETKILKGVYAVKLQKKEFLVVNKEIESVMNEREILSIALKESHPFIVRVITTFQTETRVCFMMEYLPGGDLMHHIQRGAS